MDSSASSGQKRALESVECKNDNVFSAGGNSTSSASTNIAPSSTYTSRINSPLPQDQPPNILASNMGADDLEEKGQMERKRHREKKRRSEITNAVEKLSTTMNKIDPSRTEGRRLKTSEDGDQNKAAGSSSSLHPPSYRSLNRTEIISNACEIMERLSEENQKLKEQIRILTGTGTCPPNSNNGIMPTSLLGVTNGAVSTTQTSQQQQLQTLQQPNPFGLLSLQNTIRNSQEQQAAEIERQQRLVQQLLQFQQPPRPSTGGATSGQSTGSTSSTPTQAQLQQLRQMQQLQQAQAQVAQAQANEIMQTFPLMTRQAISQHHTSQLLQLHLIQQQQQQQQQKNSQSQVQAQPQPQQQNKKNSQSESKDTSNDNIESVDM